MINERTFGFWYEIRENWATKTFSKDKFALHVFLDQGGTEFLLDCFKENRQEKRKFEPFEFSSKDKQDVFSVKAYEKLDSFMLTQYADYSKLVSLRVNAI